MLLNIKTMDNKKRTKMVNERKLWRAMIPHLLNRQGTQNREKHVDVRQKPIIDSIIKICINQ